MLTEEEIDALNRRAFNKEKNYKTTEEQQQEDEEVRLFLQMIRETSQKEQEYLRKNSTEEEANPTVDVIYALDDEAFRIKQNERSELKESEDEVDSIVATDRVTTTTKGVDGKNEVDSVVATDRVTTTTKSVDGKNEVDSVVATDRVTTTTKSVDGKKNKEEQSSLKTADSNTPNERLNRRKFDRWKKRNNRMSPVEREVVLAKKKKTLSKEMQPPKPAKQNVEFKPNRVRSIFMNLKGKRKRWRRV